MYIKKHYLLCEPENNYSYDDYHTHVMPVAVDIHSPYVPPNGATRKLLLLGNN